MAAGVCAAEPPGAEAATELVAGSAPRFADGDHVGGAVGEVSHACTATVAEGTLSHVATVGVMGGAVVRHAARGKGVTGAATVFAAVEVSLRRNAGTGYFATLGMRWAEQSGEHHGRDRRICVRSGIAGNRQSVGIGQTARLVEVVTGIGVCLLDVRQQQHKAGRVLDAVVCVVEHSTVVATGIVKCRWKCIECVVVVVECDAPLFQIVLALGAASSFAGLLYGRQKQRHQNRDDRDHNQQLNQRERATANHGTLLGKTGNEDKTKYGTCLLQEADQQARRQKGWVSEKGR